MDSDRSNKRARRSGVGEGEASSSQASAALAAAGGVGELSALEALHGDVLDAVLQQLGPVEASRVRLVSRTMREAIDRVVWRSLDFKAQTVEQIERAALSIKGQPRRLRSGLSREIKLAVGCEVRFKLAIRLCRHPTTKHMAKRWYKAVESLFSACSASSGGLGGVFLATDLSVSVLSYRGYRADEMDRFLSAVLTPLSAPEADGGSCDTLKSISIDHADRSLRDPLPPPLVKLVSSFPRLERLQLAHVLGAAASTIPGALPALRSVGLKLAGGAALAAFASHPALEELKIPSPWYLEASCRFETFAMGPAARRLRRLDVEFSSSGFEGVELPSLSRLTSLETLHLAAYTDPEVLGPEGYEEVLGGMEKLRELDLHLLYPGPARLRSLARAFAALRARSLRAVRLTLDIRKRMDGSEADAALAIGELIRAAGPALIELNASKLIFYGDAFQALAACPRLRTLRLQPELAKQPLAPLAVVVDVLVACPRLEAIDGLPIALHSEQEAAEVVEPLGRLAAACSLGDGSGCSFDLHLRPAPTTTLPERQLEEGIAAVFPLARVRQIWY